MSFINKFKSLYKSYFWNKTEKKLFSVFAGKYKNNCDQTKDTILIQCVEDYFYYSLFGQIITDLRKTKDIQVEQYIVRNFAVGDYARISKLLKSKIFCNKFSDRKWTKLYSSFCNKVAYSNEQWLGLLDDYKLFIKARQVASDLISKEELVELKSDGILIGDLIYDTYLRFKPAPTVDLNDFYLTIVIWKALRNIKIAQKFILKKKPKILFQSYSTYIQHGITARIALVFGVDVYTFGSYQSVLKKLNETDCSHVVLTSHYKTEFDAFDNKEERRLEAKKGLGKRFAGKIDLATSYMKESAYKVLESKLPDLQGKVVIFLHDFYDSPHIYKSMIFPDFLEWVEYTIKVLEKNAVECYLKPHPNQLPESDLVVKGLCEKYQNIQLLSPKITNKQLVASGIKLGITLYGTVAHELAYMGVPVITCGDNPHSSYSFCFEAKSKKQYSEMLGKTETLIYTKIEQVKKEVESFFYMHNLNKSKDERVLLDDMARLRSLCATLDDNFDRSEYQNILNNIKTNIEYKQFIKSIVNE